MLFKDSLACRQTIAIVCPIFYFLNSCHTDPQQRDLFATAAHRKRRALPALPYPGKEPAAKQCQRGTSLPACTNEAATATPAIGGVSCRRQHVPELVYGPWQQATRHLPFPIPNTPALKRANSTTAPPKTIDPGTGKRHFTDFPYHTIKCGKTQGFCEDFLPRDDFLWIFHDFSIKIADFSPCADQNSPILTPKNVSYETCPTKPMFHVKHFKLLR